jgi:hypothetical protein
MKKQPVLFFVFFGLLTGSGCHQNAEKAKLYYDKLVIPTQKVIDWSQDYGDSLHTYHKTPAVTGHQHYTQLVNKTMAQLNDTKDFEGDSSLLNSCKGLLQFYQTALEKDFRPFMNSLNSTNLSMQEVQCVDSLYRNFVMSENQNWEQFNKSEKSFYKEYGLEKLEK